MHHFANERPLQLHDVHPTDAFSIVMPTGCLLLTAFLCRGARSSIP